MRYGAIEPGLAGISGKTMAHSRDTVARVKGAARVIGSKATAFLFGIPLDTVKAWLCEDRRAEVEADMTVEEDIRNALLGRFDGRESAR